MKRIGLIFGSGTLVIGALIFYRQHVREPQSQKEAIRAEAMASEPGPPPDGTLEPTRAIPDELVSRLESSFVNVYLQLLSIIQGVAFGFLASTTLSNINNLRISNWLALFACLVVILLVWQDYMVGSTAFAWIPTLLDTVVPFGLGITEFAMIISAVRSTQSFLFVVEIAYLLGVLAWSNVLFHSRRGFSINITSNVLLGEYVRFGLFACITGAAVVAVLLTSILVFHSNRFDSIYTAITLATIMPMLLHSIWHWNRPLLSYIDKRSEIRRTAT